MKVGVIGGGTMGIGITHAFLVAGAEVTLVEPDPTARRRAEDRIAEVIAGGVARGRLDDAAARAARGRLVVEDGVGALPEHASLVVEAVPEVLDLKIDVLVAAESRGPEILASNTSSYSIERLGASLHTPDRFIGLHFFNPVWSMALVEIIISPATSPTTLAAARDHVTRIGKEHIVVRDVPGFATSRLGLALGLEAIRMVADGVASASDIDAGMVHGYGHPMGPLRLTDLVGLDVRLNVARHLASELGDRFTPPPLLEELVAQGKLGKKAGEGFYTW